MSYAIELTIDAEKDIQKFKKSGDKKSFTKNRQIIR